MAVEVKRRDSSVNAFTRADRAERGCKSIRQRARANCGVACNVTILRTRESYKADKSEARERQDGKVAEREWLG
jgi:hypothetical protein